MRVLCACITLALLSSAAAAEPGDERIKKQLASDNYSVIWGAPAPYAADAELEIGQGNGHGFSLAWMRFVPGKDGVDVLSIRLEEGWQPYKSKWPPDRAPVAVQSARMNLDAYAALLRDLAVVDAAKLKPVERNGISGSSNDFWVYAHIAAKKNTLVDLDWAGYEGSSEEIEYAKPRALVSLAGEAVKGLDFQEHALTDAERGWASAKFARDWKKLEARKFSWWVRERYILLIGVVGDAAALPTLRHILGGDPKDRSVYYAINAVTRLTKKDVRDPPVEEMDVEATRRKVLASLPEGK